MKKLLILTASLFLAMLVSYGQTGENKKRSIEHIRKQVNGFTTQAPGFKSSFASKQSLDSVILKEWSEQEKSLLVYGKIYLLFDANEKLIEEIKYEWEMGQSIQTKLVYEYAPNGNLTQIDYFSYYSDQWNIEAREVFTYNEDGKLTEEISSLWDETEEQWYYENKIQFTYDVDGRMTEEIWWWYNDGLFFGEEGWMFSTKKEYTYNAEENLIEENAFLWDDYDSLWTTDDKTVFSFDASGNLSGFIASEWCTFEEEWSLTKEAAYDFDANGNVIREAYFVWDEDAQAFIEDSKYDYQYDLSFTLSELVLPPLDWFALDYSNTFLNKLLSCEGYEWDSASNGWHQDYEEMYYYSEKSTSINEMFEGSSSGIFPNPFSDVLSFSFPDHYGQITFELFDLQGRKLMSKTVHEGETIHAAALKSGIYLYNLYFDGERQSGKIIKQ